MQITEQHNLSAQQKQTIFRLWNNEYPERLTFANISDLESYLTECKNPTHYFLFDSTQAVAWASKFERAGEKWFALIVDSHFQGSGLGKKLLQRICEEEKVLNGWVIDHDDDTKPNGKSYLSPLAFYQKNNFAICNDIRLETNKLSAVKIQWTAYQ